MRTELFELHIITNVQSKAFICQTRTRTTLFLTAVLKKLVVKPERPAVRMLDPDLFVQ